jgi:hypothetical protein
MLPAFEPSGLLPAGVHPATFEVFLARFVSAEASRRRKDLGEQLTRFVADCKLSPLIRRLYVGGSFVTSKDEPNDFDCILVFHADPAHAIRPFEYYLLSRRRVRKLFGGDVLAAAENTPLLTRYLEFFQTTRELQRTGIVEIEL